MATITHRGLEIKAEDVEAPSASAPIEKLHDYYWVSQREPHAIRRKAIMKAHPEVKRLMGHEPLTKYILTPIVLLQLVIAYQLRSNKNNWILMIILSYVVGASANNNIFLAVHEITHNLAFKKPLHNKIFAILVNSPVPLPFAADFGPYHQLHHKFLGDELYDTDIPTNFEAHFFSSVPGKLFYAIFQIIFYVLRPPFISTIPFTKFHFYNIAYQVIFDFVWIRYVGWHSFMYFIFSAFFAGSLHPLSGHFIAEHFLFNIDQAIEGSKDAFNFTTGPEELFDAKQLSNIKVSRPDVNFKKEYALETFSYYGPLNYFVWNAGLHNEHHDFPFIPWSRLWKLNRMAPEFYDPLPRHESWIRAIFDFVFNSDLTLYHRVRRVNQKLLNGKKP